MELLTVKEKDGTDYKLYELKGGLNAYTIVNIAGKVYEKIQKTNVVLDMANITELDSSGIGMIMAAHNDGEESGKKIYLLSISNEVDRQILATGFKDELNIISSVTEVD